ncbi:bifunctional 3-(3-hydroxy-phenyl)propionate/3-hydroxycinnamic acid hydroxylase [Nocardia sp. FBN12]|uniref:bifunctional 3-(3-hydroxy-phenyl)propionate/3-hydroxycinnamic acid hydroxylase n=1 Tax=Nocardia sp. FBN12 TaxID=3419766 RepID=UPI003CFF06EA
MGFDVCVDPASFEEHDDHFDVIVVGCGPTGATLANRLRAQGYRVAVFDREKEVFAAPRAMLIDDESERIFGDLGVLEQMRAADLILFDSHRFVDGRHRMLADLRPLESGLSVGWMFHQPTFERLLRAQFDHGVGVSAFFGFDVVGVANVADGAEVYAVDAESGQGRRYRADYVVGCDGGSSVVRRSMGVARTDFGFSQSWVVVDAVVHDQEFFESLREGSEFMCRPGRAAVFVKGCHRHLRFDFQVDPAEGETDWSERAREHIAGYMDPAKVRIIRVAPYQWYAGMPRRWRSDRLLLAGDAAHQTPPFAGQGLNMGLRDAMNLAFKLDAVLAGRAPDALLDTYEQERWDNCAEVIEGAVRVGRLVTGTGVFARVGRAVVLFALRHSKTLVRARANADLRKQPYRAGLIGGTHALSGTLMVNPRVTVNGVATVLDRAIGNEFTLLSLHPHAAVNAEFVRRFDGRVMVLGDEIACADGELTEWFRRHRVEAVLVRPDRYIFDAGNDPDALATALIRAIGAGILETW